MSDLKLANETQAPEFLQGYLQSVLGLRYFPRFEARRPRLIVLDLPVAGGLANNEMFRKMMAAIGLSMSDILVKECLPSELPRVFPEISSSTDVPVLSFSEELSQTLGNTFGDALTTLKGPRDLIHQPQLKRETWLGLQDLVKKIAP